MNHEPSLRIKPQVLQKVDRLLADLNALLVAVAIGLAVLDFTIFATLVISDQVLNPPNGRVASAFYTPITASWSMNDGRAGAPVLPSGNFWHGQRQ